MKRFLAAGLALAALLAGSSGRAQADVGWLDVSSDPSAEIFIDDADTQKATPQSHLPLSAGHHRLKLVTPDGARKRSIGFNVEAGKTTKLTIHLAS
jgi:hypothetical protein